LDVHAFFGFLGSLNDINVLDRTLIFQEMDEDWAPKCEYVIHEHEYKIGYLSFGWNLAETDDIC